MDNVYKSAKPTYSQSGEDRIIEFLFTYFRNQIELRYLDIGAAYPIGDNNTYLSYLHGGRGVLVEADPDYTEQYKLERAGDVALNIAVVPQRLVGSGHIDFILMHDRGWSTVLPEHAEVASSLQKGGSRGTISVPCTTINQLCLEHCNEHPLDLLSIDIEGIDKEVLEELDLTTFRPKAIIAENAGGESVHQKSMIDRGYQLYAYTYINSIYIDPKEFKL